MASKVPPDKDPNATGPDPPPPDASRPLDALIESRIPGLAKARGKSRIKVLAAALTCSLVASLATSYFAFGFNLLTLSRTTAETKKAEEAYDDAKSPVHVTVRHPPPSWKDLHDGSIVLLGRTLTPQEQARLTQMPFGDESARQKLWQTIQELDPRAILAAHPPTIKTKPEGDESKAAYRATYTPYELTLQSDRSISVTVDQIHLTDVRCGPSAVKTVIEVGTQGSFGVEKLVLDFVDPVWKGDMLQAKPEAEGSDAYVLSRYFGTGQGPFSSTAGGLFIALGDGQPAWVGEIGAMVGTDTCTWKVDISSTDARRNTKDTRVLDNGKPFVATGLPRHFPQYFGLGVTENGTFAWTCNGSQVSRALPCFDSSDPSGLFHVRDAN